MSEEDELRKELERLRRENARLRGAPPKTYSVTEGEYKGHPTLTIEGPGLRPSLTLGLAKLRAIQATWADVQKFLAKHTANTSQPAVADDGQI